MTGGSAIAAWPRAYLERNGSISVIAYAREPQVMDVFVKDGVQNVRIKIE